MQEQESREGEWERGKEGEGEGEEKWEGGGERKKQRCGYNEYARLSNTHLQSTAYLSGLGIHLNQSLMIHPQYAWFYLLPWQ